MRNKIRIITIAIAAAGFTAILVAVCLNNRAPVWLDIPVQNFMLEIRNSYGAFIFRIITLFGEALTIAGVLLILNLIPATRKNYGVPLAISEVAACIGYSVIKELVARSRPEEDLRLVIETTYSFPSGHTISSFLVYALLIYLMGKYMKNKVVRRSIETVLIFLIVFIPFTRIYLCAHWFTDVIAGWLYGVVVLVITIMIIEKSRKKELDKERLKKIE